MAQNAQPRNSAVGAELLMASQARIAHGPAVPTRLPLEAVRRYLRTVIATKQMTGAELARMIGTAASTINRPLSNKGGAVSINNLLKIEHQTGIKLPTEILDRGAVLATPADDGFSKIRDNTYSGSHNAAVRSAQRQGSNREMPREPDEARAALTTAISAANLIGRRDLPIYASAQGGADGMTVIPEPIDWVDRPADLLHAKEAFGVYLLGDSMHPRFEQGDMVIVSPALPPAQGNDVLICAHKPDGETTALVKRLLRVERDAWYVEQFNPPKKYRLPKTDWQVAYPIVHIKPRT